MRGQGNIIVATVFFSVVLLAVIPLALNMYHSSMARAPVYENPVYRIVEQSAKVASGDVTAFFNASNSVLRLINRGGSGIEFERIVLFISCSDGSRYLDLRRSMRLESGQQVSLEIEMPENLCENPSIRTLHIVTLDGVVISSTVITISELGGAVHINATVPTVLSRALPIIPVRIEAGDRIWNISVLERKGFEISTLDSMDSPARVLRYPQLAENHGMKGGTTTVYIWILNRVENNVSVSVSGQTVRSLWIGYDPRDSSRYNMIIAADSITMTVGSASRGCSSFARVKIYGFRSTYPQGILQLSTGSTTRWITKPEQDVADYTFLTTSSSTTRLTLLGSASRVEIYCRGTGSESSYNPYTMLMNTAGSGGYAGLLFTAIDRAWGFYNSRNEGNDQLLDYSVRPFALVYRGFAVSNINYSNVVISVNYRFHDNEGSDAAGTSADRPVMIVGLVDEAGTIYSYRSYTFRELTRYEDTYPPTAQAQSSLFFAPLPPKEAGERKFYAFIAFQDPYHYSGNLDDLDFTLYIESVTIIPFT